MPTSDPADRRMFTFQQKRLKEKILKLAKDVHEYSGYLLRDVETSPTTTWYAQRIEAGVAELRRHVAALDALNEVSFIVQDAPEAPQ